uniref:Uncharacterized protein n=1 Tax=Anguilla anguilla TaxID=7936 RepID=A0A0E9Q629_ANGAN
MYLCVCVCVSPWTSSPPQSQHCLCRLILMMRTRPLPWRRPRRVLIQRQSS